MIIIDDLPGRPGGLSHIIAGSIEATYVVINGEATWGHYSPGTCFPLLQAISLGVSRWWPH